MKSKILTIRDAAQLMGISPVTIERWIHQGKIPFKVKGEAYYFKKAELVAWADAHDLQIRESQSGRESHDSDHLPLTRAIELGGIHRHVEGHDIWSAFESALSQLGFIDPANRKKIHTQLLNREEMASTGVGRGIALPHSRNRMELGLSGSYVPLIFLEKGIDFNAMDDNPVHTLFMMFTPDTQTHLKILSRISHILSDDSCFALINDESAGDEAILEAIRQAESSL